MMRRSGWWRSVPPEIGVPTVISGVMYLVVSLMGDPRAWAAASVPNVLAPGILVLCGLRELRRRLAGTAGRMVGLAVVVQAVIVVHSVVSWFVYPLGIDPRIWFKFTFWALPAEMVCLALVVGIAARGWRSVAGLLLVVALVFDDGPRFMGVAFVEKLGDPEAVMTYFALTQLVQKVAVLAMYGRLGAAAEASTQQARAVRAARRAAISQWLQAGSIAIGIGLAFVLEELDVGWLSEVVLGAAMLAIIAATAGVVSGLLGLARSHLAGLSPLALCTAAFGALWLALSVEVQAIGAYLGTFNVVPSAWLAGEALACLLCIACGAVAIRRHAARVGDRYLAYVLSRRVTQIVALDGAVVGCLVFARPETTGGTVAVVVALLVCFTAVHVALADMLGRLGGQLKLALTVDVF